jgi:hypothetical protein
MAQGIAVTTSLNQKFVLFGAFPEKRIVEVEDWWTNGGHKARS